MRNGRILSAGAVVVMLLAVAAGPVRGVVNIGPDGDEILGPEEAQSARLLGPEYKDDIHGFKIRTPAGARIVQQNGTQAAQERLSFALDDKQWGGTIEAAFFKPATFTPEEYLKSSAAVMSQNQNFKAVQILTSRPTTISGRPAALQIASVEAVGTVARGSGKDQKEVPVGKLALLKQELAVQVKTNEYLVLTLYGPLKAKDELMRTFSAMSASFNVYEKSEVESRRLAAIRAGKDWFSERSAEELTAKLIKQPQLFRVKIDGKDMGYVRIDEIEENPDRAKAAKGAEGLPADRLPSDSMKALQQDDTSEGLKGISIYTNSRTFPPSGSVIMSQNHAFWAYGRQDSAKKEVLQYSRWDNNLKEVTLVSGHSASAWSTESGSLQFQVPGAPKAGSTPEDNIRGGRFLLSVLRDQGNDARLLTDSAARAPQQWPIGLDIAALPKVMEFLWPRVVDLTKPSQMAFVVFNSNSNPGKLGLRTLSVIGPETVNIDGQSTRATKLMDEIDPGTTTLWVDSSGMILMMRTSDNALLVPTTEQKMDQVWHARLAKVLDAPAIKPKD